MILVWCEMRELDMANVRARGLTQDTVDVAITINGGTVEATVEPRMLLVDFIRDTADLRGTRIGCDEGACGACTDRRRRDH